MGVEHLCNRMFTMDSIFNIKQAIASADSKHILLSICNERAYSMEEQMIKQGRKGNATIIVDENDNGLISKRFGRYILVWRIIKGRRQIIHKNLFRI